jgi:hypothetical protein
MRCLRLAGFAGSVTLLQVGRRILPRRQPSANDVAFFRSVLPAGDSVWRDLLSSRPFLGSVLPPGDSFLRGLSLWCGTSILWGRFSGQNLAVLGGRVLAMIRYVVNDGRLLSLRATEWAMLLIGGLLAGSPLLLF